MTKKFRLLMALVLVIGLFGGLLTASTVSADPTTGTWIEVPRIDKGTVFGQTWDTKIQIQNTGAATWVLVDFWKGWSRTCPPATDTNYAGVAEMWLPAGGVWTLHDAIPAGAESAFIFSCAADPDSAHPAHPCPEGVGSELAVTVDRWGLDPSGATQLSSSYTGIADPDMVDPGPPYEYYAPYVMHGYNNLDTTISIQNSGDKCVSIWIYYKEEANCEMQKAQHIEQIRPGEAIRIGPGADADYPFPSPELNAPWLGSAYVTANVPLAIVVDQLSQPPSTNQGTLLSMRGMPYYQEGEDKWYADLLYRENSGYTSAIQVQNLTKDSQPTFVTVDFFDQSGDEILFVGDWVCRNAAATFYLPAIVDLGINFPFGYVGAAEIASSEQIDYPGGEHEGEPIFAVVDIKKTKVWDGAAWRHTVAGETQGGAYNAHPEHQKENAWGWAMPFIAKEQEGVTSRIAVRNNSNCNKIQGRIDIKDETGNTVAYIPVPWLHPKHMKVFDLAYFGQVFPGFLGAAEFNVVGEPEQLCDKNGDGETDIEPVMPSLVVLNYGYAAELDPFNPAAAMPQTDLGDLTRVYEATPITFHASPCDITVSGNVIDKKTLEPIKGATVAGGGETATTDSTGYYEFTLGDDETWFVDSAGTVTASADTYTSSDPASVSISGCADVVANFELDKECNVTITGYVEDKETGEWINGAVVSATTFGATTPVTTTTAGDGAYTLAVPFTPDEPVIVSVTAPFYNPAVDTVYMPACDTTAQISFQLHDTPMKQILMYYGNCGESPYPKPGEAGAPTAWITEHNFYTAETVMEYFGYDVQYTNDWPTDPDLEEYKVIFLLGPGDECSEAGVDNPNDYFTVGQIAQLDLFLRNGGRLVVTTDVTDTGLVAVEAENNLLQALMGTGADAIQYVNAAEGSTVFASTSGFTPDQLLGDTIPSTPKVDVNTLTFANDAISLTVGANVVPGVLADEDDDADPFLAAGDHVDTPLRCNAEGYAGDIVVVGDKDWFDDDNFMGTITYGLDGRPDYVWPDWDADNENLFLNIFTF